MFFIESLLSQVQGFGMAEWVLVGVSFFTSLFTVVAGLGGGVTLLAVMVNFFPPLVVIPVHGVVQAGSNFFRTCLMHKFVEKSIFMPFLVGAFIGAYVGGTFVVALDETFLKFVLGLFILYAVHAPKMAKFKLNQKWRLYFGGGLTTFLSLFIGSTGPLAAAFVGRSFIKKEHFVATLSACMLVQHGLKIFVFGALGFAFSDYFMLITLMILTGFFGTYTGKHILFRMPEKVFMGLYKTVMTLLALRLLYTTFLEI